MRQKSELRPYQDRVATALFEHDHKLCVIRPGGGKTISALTAIGELLQEGVIRHALVIAPKRVARNVWPDEILNWAHTRGLKYQVLAGSPAQRKQMLYQASERQITIVGIDVAQWLVDEMMTVPPQSLLWDLLVIDEVSKLRDPTGKRAKALAKIAGRWKMRWGLSGTLRPNSAMDLFMPARVILGGGLWGRSFYGWRKAHFYQSDPWGYQWTALPGHEALLHSELAPHVVTLADNEMPQLPELQILFDYVELPADARKQYREMEKKLVTGKVTAANAAVATGKLAQIANGFVYGDGGAADVFEVHDEKRDWLVDIIEGADGNTIIVYQYQKDLAAIQELLPQIPVIGAGGSDRESTATIAAWNRGELPFLALHPAAGGHGLNLQDGGADMVWIAPTWSPELWEQTIARLHRSGQTQPVIVRVCVSRETVDQMKLDRVHGKMTAQAAFEKYLREAQVRVKTAG